MVHTNEKEAKTTDVVIDIKATDPVRDPAASTTNEDVARAEGEGMVIAPPPRRPPSEKATTPSRKPKRARR